MSRIVVNDNKLKNNLGMNNKKPGPPNLGDVKRVGRSGTMAVLCQPVYRSRHEPSGTTADF